MDLINIQEHSITEGTLGKHFLFYGAPGTRKTTVASNFSKPLFLATEVGYQFIPGVKAVNIDSWYTFKAAVRELKKDEVKEHYDTIVIDTLNLLAEQCASYICDRNSINSLGDLPFGKAWTAYRQEMTSTFNLIAQLGYGVVFISHAKEATDDDGKMISVGPGLDNTTFNIINALADMIFYVAKTTGTDDKETVLAFSSTPPSIKTKSRVRNYPSSVEFTYESIDSNLRDAISKIEVNVGEDTTKIVAQEKRSLDDIKAVISDLFTKATELKQQPAALDIIGSSLQGVKVGEATEAHRNSLMAIELALTELTDI